MEKEEKKEGERTTPTTTEKVLHVDGHLVRIVLDTLQIVRDVKELNFSDLPRDMQDIMEDVVALEEDVEEGVNILQRCGLCSDSTKTCACMIV